ncbi:MAG: lytic transglycosylase domain-containing protein [Gammaproteobacteria bacterium]
MQATLIRMINIMFIILLCAMASVVLAEPDSSIPIAGPLPTDMTTRNTEEVGTVSTPTIDGGIINAAGNHDAQMQISVGSGSFVPQELHISMTSIKKMNDAKNMTTMSIPSSIYQTRARTVFNNAMATGKLAYVVNLAAEQHLPVSLALIPIVESQYQDNAVSPKGALGAWQLMPQTAKLYHVNNPHAFADATVGALALLQQLHAKFGNWNLAFAAYNAGEGRVEKALAKNPNATSIEELDLPIETKNYVESINALQQTFVI